MDDTRDLVIASIGASLAVAAAQGAIGGVAFWLLGISLIDNVLRPLILSGRTAVSGLVIFFGLLGGAAAFGLLGLLIGSIIPVTTARLFDELRRSDMAEKPAS
jgi:predicted PurR-regulated permease PerM